VFRSPLIVHSLAIVAIGGAAGAVLRWSAGVVWPESAFPWTTLIINVVGSFGLALLPAIVISPALQLFLGPGLFGGFTTLSAYAVHGVILGANSPTVALTYLIITLVGCLVAVHCGSRLSAWARRR
jgi:fluoride exporter